MLDAIHKGDTLTITITVKDDGGAAKDLTGATVSAAAMRAGETVSAASVILTDAAAGQALAVFTAGALAEGVWNIQCRAVLGDETQTVAAETVTVKPSAFT